MNPDLLAWLAACNKDPLAFVLGAFPWSEPNTSLESFSGPEEWQRDILTAIRDGLLTPSEAIQLARASGHGIGKSACVAWIILWAFSTAPDTRGVVTANTEAQLKTKTWAELGKWYNLFLAREHFILTATALLSKDPSRERTWRIDQITWSEKNTEAFAGLHNKGKRILLIMDEASAIPDVIWEVAEGALTDSDTEIIWLAFGNPTRSTGRFRECFPGGRFANAWRSAAIDSRSVSITNKNQIAKWIEAYGDDSDFVRIRVKGQFPRTGLMEFFSAADIEAAMSREVTVPPSAPLAIGVDVARFGRNNSVIFPRKGRDARSIPRRVYNGINTVELSTRVHEAHNDLHSDGLFVDGGGVGGGVVDTLRNMHLFVYEVQFGAKDDVGGAPWGIQGERYANKRAAMYGAARAWLKTGAIPNDPNLRNAMLAIKYSFNNKDEILLMSKEDIMEENPDIILDDVDALVLTFAYPLAAHANAGREGPMAPLVEFDYNPFDEKRMVA
ncbi:MAG: terminase [Patescibacteria group bacterium]|nr:terminase [Patescibacteria group bacterium]